MFHINKTVSACVVTYYFIIPTTKIHSNAKETDFNTNVLLFRQWYMQIVGEGKKGRKVNLAFTKDNTIELR